MSPSTAVIQFKKYLLVNIIHPLCNLKGLNEITSRSPTSMTLNDLECHNSPNFAFFTKFDCFVGQLCYSD